MSSRKRLRARVERLERRLGGRVPLPVYGRCEQVQRAGEPTVGAVRVNGQRFESAQAAAATYPGMRLIRRVIVSTAADVAALPLIWKEQAE